MKISLFLVSLIVFGLSATAGDQGTIVTIRKPDGRELKVNAADSCIPKAPAPVVNPEPSSVIQSQVNVQFYQQRQNFCRALPWNWFRPRYEQIIVVPGGIVPSGAVVVPPPVVISGPPVIQRHSLNLNYDSRGYYIGDQRGYYHGYGYGSRLSGEDWNSGIRSFPAPRYDPHGVTQHHHSRRHH